MKITSCSWLQLVYHLLPHVCCPLSTASYPPEAESPKLINHHPAVIFCAHALTFFVPHPGATRPFVPST